MLRPFTARPLLHTAQQAARLTVTQLARDSARVSKTLLELQVSPLTTHYQLFTAHDSLLTMNYSLLPTHYSLLTTVGRKRSVPPHTTAPPHGSSHRGQALGTCTICFDELELHSMRCGHGFCAECWSGVLRAGLERGPACLSDCCPQPGCAEPIDGVRWSLLSDEDARL